MWSFWTNFFCLTDRKIERISIYLKTCLEINTLKTIIIQKSVSSPPPESWFHIRPYNKFTLISFICQNLIFLGFCLKDCVLDFSGNISLDIPWQNLIGRQNFIQRKHRSKFNELRRRKVWGWVNMKDHALWRHWLLYLLGIF